MSRPRSRVSWLVVAIIALAAPGAARAQTSEDKTAAEAAFVRGKELLDAGDVAKACDAFERSQALDPQFGTIYNLALCYERQGRLASAWALFRELQQRDRNDARRRDSKRRVDALAPRLTKMLIEVSGAVEGLTVQRNGVEVTRLVGIPSPVDPGEYEIVAVAPGHREARLRVSATRPGQTVTVAVPALDPAVEVEPPAPAAPTTGEPMAEPAPEPAAAPAEPAADPGRERRTLGVTLGVAGGLAIAGGIAAGVVARGRWNDAVRLCGDDGTCATPDNLTTANGLVDDARSAARISTVLVGVGAAVAITGLVVWYTAPRDESRRIGIAPAPAGDGALVTFGGSL